MLVKTKNIEFRVSYLAYSDINISDDVECPMVKEPQGFTYDYSKPIEKV